MKNKMIIFITIISLLFSSLFACERNKSKSISDDIFESSSNNEDSVNIYRTVIVNGKNFVLGVNKINDDIITIRNFNLRDYPEFYSEEWEQKFVGIRIPNTSRGIVFNYVDNILVGIIFEGLIDPKIITLPDCEYQNFGDSIGYSNRGIEVLTDPNFENGMIIYIGQ